MKEADLILATAPRHGQERLQQRQAAIAFGSGNVPAIIDDSADILLAVSSIILSKTFDNGMICASEQSVMSSTPFTAGEKRVRRPRMLFPQRRRNRQGAKDHPDQRLTERQDRRPNGVYIAKRAGSPFPNRQRYSSASREPRTERRIAHEKLPRTRQYHAKDFEEALQKAERLIADGGYGHTRAYTLTT